MTNDTFGFLAIIVALLLVAVLGNVVCAQVPSASRAKHTAENTAGLTDARVVSRRPAWGVLGGCHEKDLTKFTVEGTRNGQKVRIQVCAPLLGGYTVRG